MACCLSSPSQLWLFPAWRCEQLLESVLCSTSTSRELLRWLVEQSGSDFCPRRDKKRASVL